MAQKMRAVKHSAAHPGFSAAAKKIMAADHVPLASADAILASGAHHAGKIAFHRNPRLYRVSGTPSRK